MVTTGESKCHPYGSATGDAFKAPYKVVRKEFKDKGWKLLTTSDDWKNGRQKLDVICPVGHQTTKSFEVFRRGNGCRICAGFGKSIEDLRATSEQVSARYSGGACLSKKYLGIFKSHKFRCKKHGVFTRPATDIFNGNKWCQKCGLESGANRVWIPLTTEPHI